MKKDVFKNLQFLSPRLAIKVNHLTKDDASRIKTAINNKLGAASSLIAILLALISLTVFFYLQIGSGWKQIEVYGLASLIGDASCFVFCLTAIILRLFVKKAKTEATRSLLNRLVIDFTYLGIAVLMMASFYADTEKGFLSQHSTISTAFVIVAFLLLAQPIYALDAGLLNAGIAISFSVISIYGKIRYDLQGFVYYILIVAGFLLMSRVFVSILFYAETQKYIQESISNSLLDTAMYDELTHCKNRYALKKYLEEKNVYWKENETQLLLAMFDIDNFKEYNDYFSHQVGDGCLKSIATGVKKAFPSPGLEFYRYGGEEFLLFFELEKEEDPKSILEKIRLSAMDLDIKAPPSSPLGYLTISVGGYLVQTGEDFNFEAALNEVDSNLYKAKADGKNVCYLNDKKVKKTH